ncbi:MAG: hypothetical protein ACPGOY_07930 [Rhodospirillaceae bacterium]
MGSPPAQPIGFITGLPMEAALIPTDQGSASSTLMAKALVFCEGPGPDAAIRCAEAALAAGAKTLVSFGTAGGLSPLVGPGDLILAEQVVTADGGQFPTALDSIPEALGILGRRGVMIGSDKVIPDPAAKTALAEAHTALAVDMESHAVAQVAQKAGVPFLVLRVVTDPAERALPSWLLGCVRRDGTTRYGRLAKRVAANPLRIRPLLQLGRDSKAAQKTMRAAAEALLRG